MGVPPPDHLGLADSLPPAPGVGGLEDQQGVLEPVLLGQQADLQEPGPGVVGRQEDLAAEYPDPYPLLRMEGAWATEVDMVV